MADTQAGTASIIGLNHDLKSKRSFVVLVWDDDPSKHLSLPVKYGCSFDELAAEADAALKALTQEITALKLHPPA